MNTTATTTAAALFLLSLTIAGSTAAQIYTNDPEGIAKAAKAENPEAVATWEEVPAKTEADQERENVARIERRAANGHPVTADEIATVRAYHKNHSGRPVPALLDA